MVDDSISMARDVEAYYKEPTKEEQREITVQTFIDVAHDGNMDAPSLINFGHKYATIFDMLMYGVTIQQHPERVTVKDLMKFVCKSANDGDDEAIEMVEKMANYFAERTT